jgi:1-acyl-sn-glycerol-3-phosphate acyltransferase
MAKGSFLFRSARAEVRALEPIPTEGLTLRDVPELRDRVRQLISDAREEMKGDKGSQFTVHSSQ